MHNSVLKIHQKSWTAGIKPHDPSKANYHVAQDRLDAEITWHEGRRTFIEPIVDTARQIKGIRIVVEKESS